MSQVSHPAPIPLRQILSRSNISVLASPGRDRDRDFFHVGAALSMRSNPSYQSKNSSIHASPTGSSTTTTTTMIASHHPRNNLPGAASGSSHPFEHTFAGAGRRSSAASLVGGGVASSLLNNTGGGSNSRRGSAVNFAASTSATRSTSGATRDSSNNMIGREDNSLSRRQEDDDDDRSPSRPVSPRTAGPAEIGWGRDSKQGYASGASGNGQSWLTGSPLVHPDAAPKPRDRLPSLALSFGFADELNPPPSAMDAHTGVLGSRKQSMTVGDAFSLAGFGLNAKNNGDTSWASDGTAGGADLPSLNTFRRKSSIIPPRFAPAPTVPSNGVRYPSSSANPLDRVADARPGESYLTARRSSNIGLLLNPVGDQDDAGKAPDAPIDPNSGSPQHNYRAVQSAQHPSGAGRKWTMERQEQRRRSNRHRPSQVRATRHAAGTARTTMHQPTRLFTARTRGCRSRLRNRRLWAPSRHTTTARARTYPGRLARRSSKEVSSSRSSNSSRACRSRTGPWMASIR